MNRNNNMTSNFSNGKSLKPGDSALNSRKGGDNFGNRIVNQNTNSNFNMMNTNLGINNMRDKYKFDEQEMNEAKESVKLMKLKFGGAPKENNGEGNRKFGMGDYGNQNNNMNNMNQINQMNSQKGNMNHNIQTNQNSTGNYRKPFKPTFGNDDHEPIQVETNKRANIGKTSTVNKFGGNNLNSNNLNSNLNSKMNTNINVKMNQNTKKIVVQELEDNRPVAKEIIDFRNVEVEVDPDDGDDGDRIQCNSCGRKFKEEAYEKHSKICKKVFASKRKAFDVKKQRVLDSEHAALLKHQEFEEKKKAKMGGNNQMNQAQNKKAKWKRQSEEFRAIMKAGNATQDFPSQVARNNFGGNQTNIGMKKPGMSTGMNYNQRGNTVSVPSVITEDYSHCTMCNRRYNEQAYTKHLPTCERRTKEASMKGRGGVKPIGGIITNVNGTYSGGAKPNLNVKFGRK